MTDLTLSLQISRVWEETTPLKGLQLKQMFIDNSLPIEKKSFNAAAY